MEQDRNAGIDKLKSFISNGDIAILSTIEGDQIHSRPMATSDIDEDANIWFFTNEFSQKVEELDENYNISLSYTDHGNSTYVCVNGTASVINDRHKMEELFNSMVKAFFPDGLEDPKLALLKIRPKHAEYWDSNSNSMVRFMGILGSALTGEKYTRGDHGEINL